MEKESQDQLPSWQKKQAGMLHYFTSEEYLRQLHRLVTQLVDGNIDPLLETVKAQGRDALLIDAVWGDRNTAMNWSNHAWPMLKDLQVSIAKQVALRSANRFSVTAVNYYFRGMSEYSMDWATPGEEELIKNAMEMISRFAYRHDRCVEKSPNRLDDFICSVTYPEFSKLQSRIPKFIVRPHIRGTTGEIPPQTGIYICVDDPHAALQFVWTADKGAPLRVANTFNEIGLDAFRQVGRQDLWLNDAKMYAFAISPKYRDRFLPSLMIGSAPEPRLASSAVARSAFKTRSCEWVLVDIVPGEFEDLASLPREDEPHQASRTAVQGGTPCPETGFYFSPSTPGSRSLFNIGEMLPSLPSQYGVTYWQWDDRQDK
jgi:hypothetical protein